MANPDASWFARRNGAVRGPLTADHVRRCILLGRIHLNDELSEDERMWRPVMDYPELLPAELSAASDREGWERLLLARRLADERVSERRRACNGREPVLTERRRGQDRRRAAWLPPLLPHSPGTSPGRQTLRVVLLAMLLATLALVYFNASSR